jgi:hypothetical protein
MTTNPNNSFTNVSNLVGQVPTVNVADLNLVNSTVDEVVANKILLTDAHLTTANVTMSNGEIGGETAPATGVATVSGNDTKGVIEITNASTNGATEITIKVTFNKAYENAPVVIIKGGADNLDTSTGWYVTSTKTDFTIIIPSWAGSEAAWTMNYLVVGLE